MSISSCHPIRLLAVTDRLRRLKTGFLRCTVSGIGTVPLLQFVSSTNRRCSLRFYYSFLYCAIFLHKFVLWLLVNGVGWHLKSPFIEFHQINVNRRLRNLCRSLPHCTGTEYCNAAESMWATKKTIKLNLKHTRNDIYTGPEANISNSFAYSFRYNVNSELWMDIVRGCILLQGVHMGWQTRCSVSFQWHSLGKWCRPKPLH